MNRTSLAAVSLILGATLLHCGEKKPADAPAAAASLEPAELPPTPTEGPDAGASTDKSPGVSGKNDAPEADAGTSDALTDEQIASITDSANDAEIEQGKIARLKSKNHDVQTFGAMMIAAHEEAKKNQDKLKLKTAESVLGNSLGTEATSTMNGLKTAEGSDFDHAYIDAQVNEHQKLLDALNDKLMPQAKNPDLKAYLKQILPHVARHLKEARDIQHTLASKSATIEPNVKTASDGAK